MQSFPQFTVVDSRLQAGRGEEFSASRQVSQVPVVLGCEELESTVAILATAFKGFALELLRCSVAAQT